MQITEWFQSLSPRKREAVPYLLLALAVFAVYANVYQNQFLLDDLPMIVQNEWLRHWKNFPDLVTGLTITGAGRTGGFYRPMQLISYFLIYQAFGLSTAAFHALNVVLQAVNAGLVYRLGCRLGFQARAVFAAALLWGVHPLWTETVACATGTAELLFISFTLMGIMALLPDFSPRKFLWASLFFILALGSKESAIVFPALAVFTLFLVSEDRLRPATYIRTWPLWLVAVIYLVAWKLSPVGDFIMHDPEDMFYSQFYEHNIINRILTSLATLPTYLGLIIWPSGLHMERTFPVFTTFLSWRVLAGAALVSVALWHIIRGKGKYGLALSWGLLWFAAAQSPNTGIVKTLYALVSEHWMYLPTIGLFLGTAQTLAAWIDKQKSRQLPLIAAIVVALAALSLGIKTHFQNRVWHDAIGLYENVFKNGSDSGRAHNELGLFYYTEGDYEKAARHMEAAIAHPAPMWKNLVPVLHHRLALIYLQARPDENGLVTLDELNRVLPLSSMIPEATEALETVMTLEPGNFWAAQFLIAIYDYQGNTEKADFYRKRVEEIQQQDPNRAASGQ